MKKFEKVLMCIFGFGIAAFLADCLFEFLVLDETSYLFFLGITKPLSYYFIISVFGIMAVLTTLWVRKRREAGLEPISKAYTLSFFLSFIPFVLVVFYCAAQGEFVFMGETMSYGFQAFLDHMVITVFAGLCVIVPIFPILAVWQILYLVHRKRNRKKAVS